MLEWSERQQDIRYVWAIQTLLEWSGKGGQLLRLQIKSVNLVTTAVQDNQEHLRCI